MSEEINSTEAVQKPVKIWRRKNIHLVTAENDIKFRGPLSYRYLRIAGWVFLLLAQLGMILSLATSAKLINVNSTFLTILKSAGSLMTPVFRFAAFAQVLVAKDGYRRLMIVYSFGALGIYLLFIFVYLHFGVGLFASVMSSYSDAMNAVNTFINALNATGTLSFNLFIDLILCTLVTFFINYRPTVHFQGKKIYLFHSFVLIPILYELGSIALKMLSSAGVITMSPFLIPLMTTKPPVAFFIFLVLALFVKNREKHYIKHGKTHEDYKAFLNTNVNRLHFSLFLVGTIVVAVIVDLLLFIGISVTKYTTLPKEVLEGEGAEAALLMVLAVVYGWGFGKCLPMIFIIPLIIFFDYTKTHKNKIVDTIIPVAGIGLLAVVYVEGLFEILKYFLAKNLKEAQESGGENAMISLTIQSVKSFLIRK